MAKLICGEWTCWAQGVEVLGKSWRRFWPGDVWEGFVERGLVGLRVLSSVNRKMDFG